MLVKTVPSMWPAASGAIFASCNESESNRRFSPTGAQIQTKQTILSFTSGG
jgi:hypothetical protein